VSRAWVSDAIMHVARLINLQHKDQPTAHLGPPELTVYVGQPARDPGCGRPPKAGATLHLGGVIRLAGRRGREPVARAQRPVHDLDQAHHATEGVVVGIEQQQPQVARGVAAAPAPRTSQSPFPVFLEQ